MLMLVNCIDPRKTEEFLLSQDDVIDASVWIEAGELSAYVTVTPDARTNPDKLRYACAAHIGENHVPQNVTLVCARPRAA
jgi:hypothetical protein